MIGFFTSKYPSTDAFAVIRSLAWFEDAEMESDPLPLAGLTWSKAKSVATAAIARL